jgi:hypothetical protein
MVPKPRRDPRLLRQAHSGVERGALPDTARDQIGGTKWNTDGIRPLRQAHEGLAAPLYSLLLVGVAGFAVWPTCH